MSGVGSTNAMKKGSGNNPFLAYSKADMASFLNSAYTGCIVKYTGPSTKVEVLTSDRNKDAQHLVFDITKPFVRPGSGIIRYAMKIDKTTDDGVKTTYICHKWINKLTGRLQNGLGSLDESEYWVYALIEIDDINFDNIKGNNVKFLAVTESLSEIPSLIDLHQDWPTTKGINGWQTNCINEAGKITLWSYSEDVKYSYADGGSVSLDEMIYYEPYVVNELYEVVYGNGRYYFEEFYHISDDVTTTTVEDVAPGKTFYDFTGTKQTGIGTKINPYIATDLNTFKSFPVGSFIKWIGPDKTVLDETTGQTLMQGEIYRAVEDGDVFQYVILPTLSNPGTAADLTQGKQLIDGEGKVVEGTLTDDIDYTQDVMFWDYDGKLIYACTLNEAKAMTKLPDVPDHSDKGLVFLKWNYTLDDIKNISHGADIGALYETSDGKTHLFFDIVSDLTKDVTLYIIKSYNSQDGTLRIDWGDGTAEEIYEWDKNTTPSSANFPKHTYTTTGQYEVKIENISAYTRQYIYLGSINYSISEARNLFGLALRYGSTNTISTILTKAYVGQRMALSCGACVNLTEISLRYGSVAPCGLQNTQVKHVNVSGNIELYAFRYSAIQTFSCSANSIEPGAFQNCSNIKRIACKAYTQTYSDSVSLDLLSLRVCIWPRRSSYRVQLNIKACKKVVLDYVTQWDNNDSSASLYLLAATKLYMKKFYPYGNNTKVVAGIISAPMLEQLIMDNVTPTPLTTAFTKIPNTCKYYVPDSAVDAYKAADGWSSMADRIYPMSELTN